MPPKKLTDGENTKFDAIQSVIKGKVIYVGTMKASELHRFADVPSFHATTSNLEIVNNINQQPVKEWQRPPIKEKVKEITRTFNEASEIMPNPVLVAAQKQSCFEAIEDKKGQQATGLHKITLTARKEKGKIIKPLWILDGQHRVRGLGQSDIKDEPVPLVLLSIGEGGFTPQEFAKIFAQVSTKVTPLNKLHQEWMQWAYRLEDYGETPVGELHYKSMQTVIDMCRNQSFGSISPNPFFDKIRFNPEFEFNPEDPLPGLGQGFQYDALTLKKLIFKNYYNAPISGAIGTLEPEVLAHRIVEAVDALKDVVGESAAPFEETVFFGKDPYGTITLQDAFLESVLLRLRKVDATDWHEHLRSLGVNDANWDFKRWVATLGGSEGNTSRRVASKILKKVFGEGKGMTGRTKLHQYFQGSDACLLISVTPLDEDKQPTAPPETIQAQVFQNITEIPVSKPFVQMKIVQDPQSSNIGQIKTECIGRPFDQNFKAQEFKTGVILDPDLEDSLEFAVECEFFGGKHQQTELQIIWSK